MQELKLHIVHKPNNKWVIHELKEQIKRHAPEWATITEGAKPRDEEGVINYCSLYRYLAAPLKHGRVVVYCTHPEDNDFVKSARMADHVVVSAKQYRLRLIDSGVYARNISVVRPGIKRELAKRRIRCFNPSLFAGVKRAKRKGLDLWKQLCKDERFECVASNGELTTEELIEEYRRCDVVVSTSQTEGCPMSLVEALAMNRPIAIGKGVGMADEYPLALQVWRYEVGNIESLKGVILAGLSPQRTEVDYAEDMFNLFAYVAQRRKEYYGNADTL